MRCRDVETLLCDYLDDALAFEQRRLVEEHLLSCGSCSAALEEAEFALGVLKSTPQVEPPPQLVASIIHETIGYHGGALAPAGGPRSAVFGFLKPLFHPFLQPRFVMSMAMTALSFSMLTFYGQRALQEWFGGEGSSTVTVVEAFGEDLASIWGQGQEMVRSAWEFYELQTGGAAEPESGDE